MNGEGVSTGGTGITLFLLLHKSIFFWALLAVGLCYAAYAIKGHPLARTIASITLAMVLFGTFTELGIAILWRLFFGNFIDVPTFEFSIVTIADVLPCILLVWPWGKDDGAKNEIAPTFDWLRASLGFFFGVFFALIISYADTTFRIIRADPTLQFRNFFWFFFAVRGLGGAVIGGVLLGVLAGFLPRFQWAHTHLSKMRGGIAGGIFVVMAVLIRVVGGPLVG